MRTRRIAKYLVCSMLFVHGCSSHRAKLPPDAQEAVRGFTVAPASPNAPQHALMWWSPGDCRLEYAALLGDTKTRFVVTATRGAASIGAFSLDYPPDLAPPGATRSLTLQLRDDNRWMSVYKFAEIYPGHQVTHGFYEDDAEAPSPWSHIGSQPGLRVFFPPVSHFPTRAWETRWHPITPIESVAVRTRFEGWFNIGGHLTASVSARSEDGRFNGSYLVLASGRLFWARVVVGVQPHVLEARLVSACDGPTLQP